MRVHIAGNVSLDETNTWDQHMGRTPGSVPTDLCMSSLYISHVRCCSDPPKCSHHLQSYVQTQHYTSSLFFSLQKPAGRKTWIPTNVYCCVSVPGCNYSSLPQFRPGQREDFCLKSMPYPKTVWWEYWKPSSLNFTSPVGCLDQAQLLRERGLWRQAADFKWKVF